MSAFIERNYINFISNSLERFTWKTDNVANCRCPICGDSQTHKRKARGFFVLRQDQGKDFFYYLCHNCGYSRRFSVLLKELYPEYYGQYVADIYIERGKLKAVMKPAEAPEPTFEVKRPTKTVSLFDGLATPVSELPESHIHRRYVESRKIPQSKWSKIYSTNDYKNLVSKYSRVDGDKLIPGDSRLVLPLLREDSTIFGMVGRACYETSQRYLTIKFDDDHQKVYGLESLDKTKEVFVLEGPIDSLFIPNSIACCGTYLSPEYIKTIGSSTVVLDNQPRHRDVISAMTKYAKAGVKIAIWKNISSEFKDINDMISAGISSEKIISEIKSNTFSGLRALTEIKFWAKA